MSGSILPVFRWQVFADGEPASGAKLYSRLSGSSTPSPLYTTAALNVEHTNPVVADLDGVFPIMYMAALAYQIEVTESDGTSLFPAQDNIYDLWQLQTATTQTANQVYAGPTTGAPAAPTFRALVAADLPGTILAANGTVAAPSLSFVNDPDCGLYREGANAVAAATNGVKALGIDSTQFLDSPTQPRCSAYNNTTQSINDSTTTALALNAEDFDVGALHDNASNNTRMTIPVGGDGLYWVRGRASFAANATGIRGAFLFKGGAEVERVIVTNAGAGSATQVEVTGLFALVAGDYLELYGRQESTGALNTGNATRAATNVLSIVKLW